MTEAGRQEKSNTFLSFTHSLLKLACSSQGKTNVMTLSLICALTKNSFMTTSTNLPLDRLPRQHPAFHCQQSKTKTMESWLDLAIPFRILRKAGRPRFQLRSCLKSSNHIACPSKIINLHLPSAKYIGKEQINIRNLQGKSDSHKLTDFRKDLTSNFPRITAYRLFEGLIATNAG